MSQHVLISGTKSCFPDKITRVGVCFSLIPFTSKSFTVSLWTGVYLQTLTLILSI